MGDEPLDDAPDRRRTDDYSSARIGAAAAFTLVLVVLLVLDVVVPGYDVSPGTLLPLLVALDTGEILSAHLIEPGKGYWRNTRRDPGRWPGSRKTG